MSDKTPLELELEQHERYRIPAGFKLMLIFLVICTLFLGFYAVSLKKTMKEKDTRIDAMTKEFNEEKTELLRRIRMLEERTSEPAS